LFCICLRAPRGVWEGMCLWYGVVSTLWAVCFEAVLFGSVIGSVLFAIIAASTLTRRWDAIPYWVLKCTCILHWFYIGDVSRLEWQGYMFLCAEDSSCLFTVKLWWANCDNEWLICINVVTGRFLCRKGKIIIYGSFTDDIDSVHKM
jgi:hypothetical protein